MKGSSRRSCGTGCEHCDDMGTVACLNEGQLPEELRPGDQAGDLADSFIEPQ